MAAIATAISAPVARLVARRTANPLARRAALTHRVGLRPTRLPMPVRAAAENDVQKQAEQLLEKATSTWEATEEKPAVVAITVASFVAIWAASALVEGVDRLPFFGGFFELVGLVVTAWFVYRYLLFGPDREELKKNVDTFVSKVAGKTPSPSAATAAKPANGVPVGVSSTSASRK